MVSALSVTLALTIAAPVQLTRDPDVVHEQHVEVGDFTLRAICTEGQRGVLFLHDEDATADVWRPVLERLGPGVGACAYDRRGSGESQPPPTSRGWFELLDELRRIHLALGYADDYVLVGHGLGGLYARAYAMDRTQDVGGLVLIEPDDPSFLDRVGPGIPEDEVEELRIQRALPNTDGVAVRTVDGRVRRRLPYMPLTIVTASERPVPPSWDPRFVQEAAVQVHSALARSVTGGRHVPADRSGPDVPTEDPSLVAEEVLRILRAVGG